MRFSAYVLLLLAISISLYFLGYKSIVMDFLTPKTAFSGNGTSITYTPGTQAIPISCPTGNTYCSGQPNDANPMWFFFLILLGAGGFTALLLGFSAMFVIPAFILLAIANLVIMPYSFITQSGMPLFISVPLMVIFNIITVLAIVDFLRGGA